MMDKNEKSKGKLIRVRDIPAIIREKTGVTRCRQTIYRWIMVGRASYDGRMIKLQHIERLGIKYVYDEDLQEFLREVG
jgi:hypothetical protein